MDTRVFNLAQSFFVDPESVKGAKNIGISSVDLYFKSKPPATGNKSGINNPGVFIFVCEINADGAPDVSQFLNGVNISVARASHTEITTSADASRSTKLKFETPVFVDTGKEYAFVVVFEGNEAFNLWSSKQGDLLLGTNKVSPGPSGKYVGNYFGTYYANPTQSSIASTQTTTTAGISTSWKPLKDTDLKFGVNIARYAINGVLVDSYVDAGTFSKQVDVYGTVTTTKAGQVNTSYSGSTLTYQVSTVPYEYVVYDKKNSKPDGVFAGEYVYQNTVFYPGGTATPITVGMTQGSDLIVANTNLPNGAAFNWNDVYVAGANSEYIVLLSLNSPSAGKRKTDIKEVVSIESNTVLKVSSPVAFTNNVAYFMKSPVARVNTIDKTKMFDFFATTLANRKKRVKQDLLILSHSNANSTVRFANDTINSISISANGGNYKSSDYVVIYGFENTDRVKGGYPAIANIAVNGSGNLTGIYMTNVGAGFTNTANLSYIFANGLSAVFPAAGAANTANGAGATFTVTTGATLRVERDGDDNAGGYFNNAKIVNLEFTDIIPAVTMNLPAGSKSSNFYKNPYYVVNSLTNTHLGAAYYSASSIDTSKRQIRELVNNRLNYANIPVMPSRSNEFIIIDDVTGNIKNPNTVHPGSGVLEFQTTSNNDFVPTHPYNVSLMFGKYVINNDYSGENTDYGNADAKHITSKISFAADRFSEDLVVYLRAYRPLNTDIKVFARVHNSNDPEAFDDKDWSLLNLDSGDIYSSSADQNDYVEMQFGFRDSPNTVFTLAGTVNVDTISTSNVVGTGTLFQSNATANVQVNDLVKIYSPSFPDSYAICVVDAVANDIHFSITTPINNVDITGSGLLVDHLGRIGNTTFAGLGYPMQAFNNINNSGVVRYFNSSMTTFDSYDTVQIKIVLLSDMAQVDSNSANSIPTTIPRVDDIRVVGVTV
jgi:hypothetical protein